MADTNVEIVRRAYEFYARRSTEYDRIAEGFVFHMRPSFPGQQESVDMEGLRRFWNDLDETFDDYSLVPVEFEEHGDRVLVTLDTGTRLKGSATRVSETLFHLWELRDGMITRAWTIDNREEALSAARSGREAFRRERIEALMEALNARDAEALANDPWLASDFEFFSPLSGVEGVTHVGVEGLCDWWASIDSVWDDHRVEVVGFWDVDENRAVVIHHVTGRAKGSGMPLDTEVGQVLTFRDGKLARNDSYVRPEDALRAAGIEDGE